MFYTAICLCVLAQVAALNPIPEAEQLLMTRAEVWAESSLADVFGDIAYVYGVFGADDEASRLAGRCVKRDDTDRAIARLAEVKAHRGRFAEALEDCARLPESSDVRYQIALQQVRRGDVARAMKTLDTIASPEFQCSSRLRIARELTQRGYLDEARYQLRLGMSRKREFWKSWDYPTAWRESVAALGNEEQLKQLMKALEQDRVRQNYAWMPAISGLLAERGLITESVKCVDSCDADWVRRAALLACGTAVVKSDEVTRLNEFFQMSGGDAVDDPWQDELRFMAIERACAGDRCGEALSLLQEIKVYEFRVRGIIAISRFELHSTAFRDQGLARLVALKKSLMEGNQLEEFPGRRPELLALLSSTMFACGQTALASETARSAADELEKLDANVSLWAFPWKEVADCQMLVGDKPAARRVLTLTMKRDQALAKRGSLMWEFEYADYPRIASRLVWLGDLQAACEFTKEATGEGREGLQRAMWNSIGTALASQQSPEQMVRWIEAEVPAQYRSTTLLAIVKSRPEFAGRNPLRTDSRDPRWPPVGGAM
jgi:hypothetical protein